MACRPFRQGWVKVKPGICLFFLCSQTGIYASLAAILGPIQRFLWTRKTRICHYPAPL